MLRKLWESLGDARKCVGIYQKYVWEIPLIKMNIYFKFDGGFVDNYALEMLSTCQRYSWKMSVHFKAN